MNELSNLCAILCEDTKINPITVTVEQKKIKF